MVYGKLMIERILQAFKSHPRPRCFHGDATVVDDLVTASWRDKYQITKLLFRNVDGKLRLPQLVQGYNMGLKIQFLVHLVEVFSHLWCSRTSCHEPER